MARNLSESFINAICKKNSNYYMFYIWMCSYFKKIESTVKQFLLLLMVLMSILKYFFNI